MQMMAQTNQKSEFLIGEATAGHHQIELACDACHQDAFGGDASLQTACLGCHNEELILADDSHPAKKFNDPRNADRLELLNAQSCISCHKEHQAEQTLTMGLTLAQDYCLYCHEDISKERPTHTDLSFDTCTNAGCHNYHDNRALYEDFLVEHGQTPWLKETAGRPRPNFKIANDVLNQAVYPLSKKLALMPFKTLLDDKAKQYPQITADFLQSAHSTANMGCFSCHSTSEIDWIENPDANQCQQCHEHATRTFHAGKHGMRLAQSLPAMTPSQGLLPFKSEAQRKQQHCGACHDVHSVNKKVAAVQACLNCHDDRHSTSYSKSPHALTLDLADPQQQVTCATCHLPSVKTGKDQWQIDHNQNTNLRPNEKMIRSVCMDCHGLSFTINALADRELINRNFAGQPAQHIPSVDWARQRNKK